MPAGHTGGQPSALAVRPLPWQVPDGPILLYKGAQDTESEEKDGGEGGGRRGQEGGEPERCRNACNLEDRLPKIGVDFVTGLLRKVV